jgi:3-deoxy-7-phosphoheptulonate synthase/monofunctional chorismate mutase
LVQSEAKPTRAVAVGALLVGGDRPVVIAGPCSVEPGYAEQAVRIGLAGADALRAAVFKPRTHPESFQGLGREALRELAEARRRTRLPLVSEVLSAEDAEVLGDAVDVFQVGARNMQNFRLLEALGEIGRPVVLKRGLAATVDEWVAASEYIRRRGNDDVILCERGIRTFETRTRNTLDVSSVLVVRELTDLPVIVDPSHAAGRRRWVPGLAAAALAAGADGVLVEAHPEPEAAWTDADQAIGLDELALVVALARRHARRTMALTVDQGREDIDRLDAEIAALLDQRLRLARNVQRLKRADGLPHVDGAREAEVVERYRALAGEAGEEIAWAVLGVSRGPLETSAAGRVSAEIPSESSVVR